MMRVNQEIITSRRNQIIKFNDPVILYFDPTTLFSVILVKNGTMSTKFGTVYFNSVANQRFGRKLLTNSKKWFIPLSPSPELNTLVVEHKTQILYHADISLILILLNAIPNKRIIECGTGSCSLTFYLSRAVGPKGKIFTYEFHKERYTHAVNLLKTNGHDHNVKVYCRDVNADGFITQDEVIEKSVDAVFLDLPDPKQAIMNADKCLKNLGVIVLFNPCIEQTQNATATLKSLNYSIPPDIRTFEILSRPWGSKIIKNKSDINEEELYKKKGNESCLANKLDSLFSQDKIKFFNYCLTGRNHTGYITVGFKKTGAI